MATTALMKTGGNPQMGVRKLWDKYLASENARQRLKVKAEETVEGIVRTGEVMAGAFTLSGIQGAYWDNKGPDGKQTYGVKLFGTLPLDLAVGGGLHVLSVMGIFGRTADHVRNFADGALASYVSSWARGIGYRWAQGRKAAGKSLPGKTGQSLEDDVAAMLSA